MNERTEIVNQCLAASQEIEMITSQVYHFYADHFADVEQIAHVWRQTALEEECHARQVALARRSFAVISCPGLDAAQTEATRNMCRVLFETIKNAPLSLEDAIMTAIELEEMLAQLHMDNAGIFDTSKGMHLFRGLMIQDMRHIAELEKALESLPSGGCRAA